MADQGQAAPTAGNAGGPSGTTDPEHGNGTATTPETTPTPASLDSFGLDDLLSDPRVKKHFDDQAAALKAKYRSKPVPKTNDPPAQPDASDPPAWAQQMLEAQQRQADVIAKLQARDETSRFEAALSRHQIAQDRDVLEALHAKEKPADLEAWLGKLAKRWPATQPQPGKEKPTPGATPSGSPRTIETMEPKDLSLEDVRRLQGEGRFLEVLERYRHGGNNGTPMPFGRRPLPK